MDELSTPKKWSDLPETKKKEIQAIYANLEDLITFSNKANLNLFIYLYGKQTGTHLWSKFREFDNIIKFFNYLDVENRTIVLANIYGRQDRWGAHPLYAHCNK